MANEQKAPISPELEERAISPRFILKIAPALKPYIVSAKPTWAHIVEAADWVRGDLGISRHAWIEACTTMGRYTAAAAVALDLLRPPNSGRIKRTEHSFFVRALPKNQDGKAFKTILRRQAKTTKEGNA